MTDLLTERGSVSRGMPSAGTRPGEIRPLTGIRGLAALWVVLLHLVVFTPNLALSIPNALGPVVHAGYFAVDLFFVLSGFVLAMTGMRRVADNVKQEFVPFIVARAFRLYPLHLSVLAAYAIFIFLSGAFGTSHYRPEDLVVTALLIQVWRPFVLSGWNVPSWSIAAEMVAYLGFPLLALFATSLRRASLAIAVALFSIAIMAVLLLANGSHTLEHVQRLGIVRCVGEFAAGVMLWRYLDLRRGAALPGDALLIAGLAVFGAVIAVPAIQLVIPVGCCALVAASWLPGPLASALFGNRLVHFLGVISFSVYLDHFLIFAAADEAAQALDLADASLALRLAWVGAQLALVIGVATLTWRFLEKPSQALGRRLWRRLEARRSARRGSAALADLAGTGVR